MKWKNFKMKPLLKPLRGFSKQNGIEAKVLSFLEITQTSKKV